MTVAVRDPVATMSRGLDDLRTTLSGLDDKGITQTLRDIEALSRITQSVMLDVVAEAEGRGIAVREGFGTTAGLLAAMLQLSAADARTRVEHAGMVGPRRTITGETLAPELPATSAAFAAGEIGSGQLREPPHLTVIIHWDALRTGLGAATLDYGQLISAGDASRLACDCRLIPVVLGSDSEPLDVGRAMRTIPLGIRRALVA